MEMEQTLFALTPGNYFLCGNLWMYIVKFNNGKQFVQSRDKKCNWLDK